MAENELPRKAIPDVAKYRKSDVIFANGMSRNRVMADPELRKLYYEDVIARLEAETKAETPASEDTEEPQAEEEAS